MGNTQQGHARLHRLPERYCPMLHFGNLLVVVVEILVFVTTVEVSEVRKLEVTAFVMTEVEVLFSSGVPFEVVATVVAVVCSVGIWTQN